MGFFRKKTPVNNDDKVFKDFGYETNEVKSAQPPSRKEAVAKAEKEKVSQIKKDQLLDKLYNIRKEIYKVPGFERYVDNIEESISRLKNLPDNVNQSAMNRVDNFILRELDYAMDFCNRKNFVAMGACVDNIDELINDRFNCGDYYTNDKYCKFVLQRNKLNIELQIQQSVMAKLERRMSQLEADYNNPALNLSRSSVVRERDRIKQEYAMRKSTIDNIESQVNLINKSINQIRLQDISHSNDNVFNYREEMDDVLSIKRENELDEGMIDKFNEKMDESRRNVSSRTLNLNDDVMNASDFEDSDDISFKL